MAQVAEVGLEAGQIRVYRVACAVDCGLVVNPNIAAQQVEGNIVMGLGSTLANGAFALTGQRLRQLPLRLT